MILGLTGASEPQDGVDAEKDWKIDASNMERMLGFLVIQYQRLATAIYDNVQ